MSHRGRRYELATMDVETYTRSQTFLRRYQVLSLIQTITDSNKSHPIAARTADFLVDQYLRKYSFMEFRNRRLICKPEDDDIDDNGHTKILRHPRPIHRGEVYFALSEHCEWILNEPWVKRKHLLNLREWEKFCVSGKKRKRKLNISDIEGMSEDDCTGRGEEQVRIIEPEVKTVKKEKAKKVSYDTTLDSWY
jgi:hypothetical protein